MLKERRESKRNLCFSSRPPLGTMLLTLWELVAVSGAAAVVLLGGAAVVAVVAAAAAAVRPQPWRFSSTTNTQIALGFADRKVTKIQRHRKK